MARDNISLVPAVRTVQTSKEGSLTNPISCDTPRDLDCDVLDGVQIIQSLQTLPLLFNTEYLQLATLKMGLCELLSLRCINFKNLCAHHQEEVLRIPKHPRLTKFTKPPLDDGHRDF